MEKYFKPVLIAAALITGSIVAVFVLPPATFPSGSNITVSEGATITDVTSSLKSQQVVRSALALSVAIKFFDDKRGVIAGDYLFDKPMTVFGIAKRLSQGIYSDEIVKVTIPEGLSVKEIGELLALKLPDFDHEQFVILASGHEGELFPDTYFFSPAATPNGVFRQMVSNFRRQIADHSDLVFGSGRRLNEILVMASILEEEAKDPDARRLIAGILWKRYDSDMPLQVDAVFPYIIGKNSFELTKADLATDSPYNTYKYKGLPPKPITNPGLDSILAALEPEDSPYWFYLSDYSGKMHYAVNYDEHKTNKARYLN